MREVKVVWKDAKSYANEWLDVVSAEGLEPSAVETRGFLVSDSPDLIVAQSKSQDGDVHNLMVIPKGCIVEIKEG